MLAWIKRFLAAPVFEDEDETRRAGLLNAILLTLLAVSVGVIVWQLLSYGWPTAFGERFTLLSNVSLGVTSLGLLFLLRRGHVSAAGLLLSSVTWMIITAWIFSSGDIRAPSVTGYFLVIIIAGLILGEHAAVISGLICILAVAGAFYVQISGVKVITVWELHPFDLIVLVLGMGIAALLLRFSVRGTAEAFERARRNERALAESNRELEAEITERQRVEDALRESRERLRALVETTSDWIWEVDQNGVYTYVSQKVEDLLGYETEEVIGKMAFDLMPPVEAERVAERFQNVAGARKPFAGLVNTNLHKDGRLVVLETSGVPILDADGNLLGYRGIDRDITERKQAERALRESEERYRALYEDNPSMYFTVDAAGMVLSVNKFGIEQLGYTVEELVGQSVLNVFYKDDREAVQQHLTVCLQNPTQVARWEFRKVRKDGSMLWVKEAARAVRGTDGNPVVLIVCEDITERKRMEGALRRREAILEAVSLAAERFLRMDNLEQGIVEVLEYLGKATGVDRAYIFENHTGGDGTLLASQRYEWVSPGVEPQINVPRLQNASLVENGFQRWVDKLGAGEPLYGHVCDFTPNERESLAMQDVQSLAVVPIFVGAEWWGFLGFDDCHTKREWSLAEIDALKAAAGIIGATTQHKRAEEALRASEELYRTLLTQAPVGIVTCDRAGNVTHVNPALLQTLGSPSEEATRQLNMLTLPSMVESGIVADLRHCMEEATQITTEYSYRSYWGEESILRVHLTPLRDVSEAVGGVLALVEDVTEQRRLEEQLTQSAKLASIGQLAAGVAHEINNPINGIINYAQLLLNEVQGSEAKSDSRQVRFLEGILREGERVTHIVRDLLTFARAGTDAHTPVVIHDILQATLTLTDQQLKKDSILLEIEEQPNLPQIKCHSQRIQQVFLNLISNARDALNARYPESDPNKRLIIRIGLVEVKSQPYVRITFRDHGVGIPAHNLPRLFTPFFTTKRPGEGTGLGLSVSYGIVQDHHGDMQVESLEGEYTIFQVDLPVDCSDELVPKL